MNGQGMNGTSNMMYGNNGMNQNGLMGNVGAQQFVQRPPPGRLFADKVTDLRVENEKTRNTPVPLESAAFLHIAVSEEFMEDSFVEAARKANLSSVAGIQWRPQH